MKFWAAHPILLCFALLFAVGMIGAYWKIALVLAILGAAGYGLYRCTRSYDQRHLEQVRRRQMLVAHADFEHHLWMMGDARGFYGQYSPRPH